MTYVDEWLDAHLAPVCGMHDMPARTRRFAPGEEVEARAATALLAERARLAPDMVARLRGQLRDLADPVPSIVRAQTAAIDAVDLLRVLRFAESITALHALVTSDVAQAAFLPLAEDVREALAALISALAPGRCRDGYLASDPADSELEDARGELLAAEDALIASRRALCERVRAAGIGEALEGPFMLASDRLRTLAPDVLGASVTIVRETALFAVCELRADAAMLDATARCERAVQAAEVREDALLRRLAARICEARTALESARRWALELDEALARVAFVQRFACVVPRIADDAVLRFTGGRFLPLEERLGSRYVPISLDVGDAVVLSGANMGGKSSALGVCALLAACAARGLLVPAADAEIGLFSEIIVLDEVREMREGLSAFGREIFAASTLLAAMGSRRLVLVDEFARTTNPREARALLIALLNALRDRGDLTIAATHLDGIAERGKMRHYALGGSSEAFQSNPGESLDAALARFEASLDRRFELLPAGAVPRSQALDVAAAIGLPPEVIRRAREELEEPWTR